MQSKLDLINTGSLTGWDLTAQDLTLVQIFRDEHTVPVAQQGGFCL